MSQLIIDLDDDNSIAVGRKVLALLSDSTQPAPDVGTAGPPESDQASERPPWEASGSSESDSPGVDDDPWSTPSHDTLPPREAASAPAESPDDDPWS